VQGIPKGLILREISPVWEILVGASQLRPADPRLDPNQNSEDKTRLGGILAKPFRAALRSLGEGAAPRSKPSRSIALVIAMPAILAIILGVIGVAVPLGSVQATPGSGTSRELLGRATLEPFRSNQSPDFLIHSQSEKDVTIEKVTIPPGGHTGWHSHPGPSFAIVTEGQIKYTSFTEEEGCVERVFGPGEPEQALFEPPNQVHLARNEGDVDVVAYVTHFNIPVGGEITDSSPKNPAASQNRVW
jgi:quercetin dioxygenase-like cupin family protein